ncbi:MAG: HlyC/CorC family transporter [Spartobacteria bacterium]|nr:HlyC/CorC family transporter [Spartobacteria bacterium]
MRPSWVCPPSYIRFLKSVIICVICGPQGLDREQPHIAYPQHSDKNTFQKNRDCIRVCPMVVILVYGAVIVLLLMLSAFFSSAEVAFFSLDPLDLRRLEITNPSAGKKLHLILSAPTRLLSSILIGNTLVNVCASITGYLFLTHLRSAHAELVSVFMMTLLLLLFGEVTPKRLAMQFPVRMSVLYANAAMLLMILTAPVRLVLEQITRRLNRYFLPYAAHLTEDEIESVVQFGGEDGILDEEEQDMLEAIIRLEDMKASDVMTPRVDILGLDLNDLPADMLSFVRKVRVPQLVLYRDQPDQVDGFLNVRTFLLDPEHRITNAWIPPRFIPETAPLDRLLADFQHHHHRAAIVVDEYGGTAGLITRGDILEEITGEISNEYAEHQLKIERIGTNRWLIDGSVNLEDINDELELDLDEEGVDRIAGWVIAQTERLPKPGETVEAQGCRVTVQRMRKHRILLVLLDKLPPTEAPA